MRKSIVSRCIGLGFLLLLTGCSVRAEAEPAPGLMVKSQSEADKLRSKAEELWSKDNDFYVKCIQNLRQGNNITYADGYYYFRSQVENYSLCRSKGAGMPVEVVADQVPGSIYVREDQVYFINVSDSRTLYCVGTDGSEMKKLSDFPMQELIILGDQIYFRSVYDREYDPFYQLTEEAAEDDRYLYSMNLDGSGCELLVPKVCIEVTSDGKWLYYLLYEEGEGFVLYRRSLDGQEEEKVLQKEDRIRGVMSYRGDIYLTDGDDRLIRLNKQGEEEILASDINCFTIAEGQVYVMNSREIRKLDLATGKESFLAERTKQVSSNGEEREDTYPWYDGSDNRGIFVVNGQVLAKYFESEEKGVLWHLLDGEEFVVFEDMEPLKAEELVRNTSLLYESNYAFPGKADEDAEQYLDADGELFHEEYFGAKEDGTDYGKFTFSLPKFNSKLSSYEHLNMQMEGLLTLALEDKDSFFQEMSELDLEEVRSWYRVHEYNHIYIGEKYVSILYLRRGYEGGMREWINPLPMIFERETGAFLKLGDLFSVEESIYKKRLTGAVYKYCEMKGMDWWNDAFDNNVLVKMLGDLRSYLTPDGIVLCYERYEVQPGASGCPTFEIPYEWFADIYID